MGRGVVRDGVTVFTIGLGDPSALDADALREMASRSAFSYVAPDGEDLAGIYRGIAVAVPCPAGVFWRLAVAEP